MAEVVIIGAGLTGLSTAYFLEQKGFLNYKIFEKQERPGGLLRSEHSNGFTFDHTGHFLHCNNDTFKTFLANVVSFDNLATTTRTTGIQSHNVITNYPFQMNLYGLPIDIAVECIEKYVMRPKHLRQPSTFYTWVLKHFGQGFGKYFFWPFNNKLLAYDIKKVHPAWTGRFVPSTNLAAIIKGTISQQNPSSVGYNSNFYYPCNGGIEFVIKKLCASLTNPIHTNHTVSHIDHVTKKIYFENGHCESYRYLVSTMPLNQLLSATKSTSTCNLHNVADKLLYNTVVNINLGFTTNNIGPFHWLYFPERHYQWYRLGFWHNICPALAPAKHSSIYAELSYVPGTKQEQVIKRNLDLTIKNICHYLHVEQREIATRNILYLEPGYVIYDAWRQRNLSKILKTLSEYHIYSKGRYGEWKYSSMQEAVLDGELCARTLMQRMATNRSIYPARLSNEQSPQKEYNYDQQRR